MNKELQGLDRLEKLAEFLQTISRKQFNMENWYIRKPDCGTVACAAGWATHIPSFRRAGFKLLREKYLLKGDEYTHFSPVYKNNGGMDAVQTFFNLNDDDAWHLFGDDTKRTPKQEAKVLRQYVKARRIAPGVTHAK